MKSLLLKIIVSLIVLMVMVQISFASISVDSVSTIKSSCTNNGTATVYAHSNPASTLFYALVAGPALAPLQNSNVFSSLFPGNYTARIYTVGFDSTDTQFQVAGNYQLPNFSLNVVHPTCPNSTDGSITILPDTNFGLPPFQYSMTAPSVIPPQVSNYFSNLNTNTYFMRLTDACGNYQTRTGVLNGDGTRLGDNFNIWPMLNKIGCDTMEMTFNLFLVNEKSHLPLTLSIYTSSGIVNKTVYPIVIDTFNYNPGLFKIIDTIPNITYGDYLHLGLTDVCNESIYSYLSSVAPFDFEVLFAGTQSNCGVTFTGHPLLKQWYAYPYHNTNPREPISFTLTDVLTNLVVDSMYMVPLSMIVLKEEIPGNTYLLTITDGCGQVWQQNIVWPIAGTPEVQVFYNAGCIDSTAMLGFECKNFKSAVTVHFLSGPQLAQSTKPQYAYSDSIFYPQSIPGAISNYIYVKDCPKGFYTFEVTDTCGNVVQGSFNIEEYMVSNLKYTWYIKPSCLNNNTLYYNFGESSCPVYKAYITDLATNTVVATPVINYYLDSISTLPIGNYALEIYYANQNGNGAYFDGSLLNKPYSCWVLHDTINIVPYANNSFLTNNTIYCNGTNYIELIPDTTRGVPPYKFEIISGPQTFAQQESGVFQIQQFGNYVISMEDVCGNNYTQQISVTSDSFPPIVKSGFLCAGNDATLSAVSSAYFTYIWHYPNGTSFTGDSISFHPFMASDTGLYFVLKIVNINGCNDTLRSDYYLSASDSVMQSFAICAGDSVTVGNNIYHLPGIYRDTLTTFFGCDSLVITSLAYALLTTDSNALSICNGDSISVGTNFYSVSGTYSDTITLAGGCKKVLITQLSITTIIDSVSAAICQGDSFTVGNIVHQQQGVFNDTLTSVSGCDSIVVATISFTPLAIDSITFSICKGDSVGVGTNFYSVSGIYSDTITLAGGCKKLIITQLSITSIIDSVNAAICEGDSFMVGTIVHQQQGVFNDTLTSVSGCDSVVVATISFTPLTIDSNALTICKGDSVGVGTNFYSVSGTYSDTITLAGGCKKLIITQLSITSIIDSVSATICEGDSFMVGTIVHQQPGVFNDTLTSVSGCDSVVVATISFAPLAIDSNALSICKGDSVSVGTNFYSVSGIYSDTIALAGGCKKVLITQLSITSIIDSVSAAICQGDSFMVGTIIHQQPGVFNDTLTSASGCDSVVVVSISFAPLAIDSNALTICNGDSVGVGTNFYSVSGTYSDTITIAGGCKKVLITQLSIIAIIDSVSAAICQGDSFMVGTFVHQQQGIFNDTLISVSGCDSVVVATISFSPLAIDSNALTICKGDSVGVGTNFYSSSGTYSDTITLAGGCKKLIITQLSITSIIDSVSVAICQGDSFMVGTIVHQQQGLFNDTLTSVSGCDSVVALNLSWNLSPSISITSSADTVYAGDIVQLNCTNIQAVNYYWFGNASFSNQYSASTTAIINAAQWISLSVTNANGCRAIDSVFISIKEEPVADTCDDATLFIPNAFTPNDDGVNDFFHLSATNIEMKSFSIFNRWGEEIFESNTINFSWDGNFNNTKCSDGVYYYVLQFESCLDDRRRYKYGSITLLN